MKLNRKQLKKLILQEMASMKTLDQLSYRAQMFKQTPGLVLGTLADMYDPEFLEYDEDGDEEPNQDLSRLTFILQNVDQFCANVLMRQPSPQAFVVNIKRSIPDAISIIQNNPGFVSEPEAVTIYLQKVLTMTGV